MLPHQKKKQNKTTLIRFLLGKTDFLLILFLTGEREERGRGWGRNKGD